MPPVPVEEYTQLLDQSTVWVLDNVWNLVTALVVLVVGVILAKLVGRYAKDLLPKTRRVDQTVAPLISQLGRYAILTVTFIIVLSQLGINTTSILAVLGAVGLAVALALQGTLANLAAGILIIWFRPFNVGEFIEAEGILGSVVEIGLFGTRLRNYDGVFVYATNTRLWNARVTNFTREKTRMIEAKIGIAYTASIQAAREALLKVAEEDSRILPSPTPFVFVESLEDSSVMLCMRCWVKGSEWWQTNVDVREATKLALDAAGVEIPYNKVDLYIKEQAAIRPAA